MLSLISTVWDVIKKVFGLVSGAEQANAVAEGEIGVAALQAQGNSVARWMSFILSVPAAAYLWKAVLWDNVIAIWYKIPHQTTPALVGPLSWYLTMVIGFYFLHTLSNK